MGRPGGSGASVGPLEVRTQDSVRLVMLVSAETVGEAVFVGGLLPGAHRVLGQPLCPSGWHVDRVGGPHPTASAALEFILALVKVRKPGEVREGLGLVAGW